MSRVLLAVRRCMTLGCVVPLAAALYAVPAIAAGGSDDVSASTGAVADNGDAIQEVVVTARRRAERLVDVPVAVSEVNAQTLQQVPSVSLTQIGNLVPGVSLERMGGGSTGAAFTIRGVGQLAQDFNTEQPVALNLDGVQVTKGPAAQVGFFDLQSMQVLKGPQALFFGKNSPAGVIAIDSVTPGSTMEGYVRLGYEFYTSAPALDAALTIPISDTLSVRVAGHFSHENTGYIKNVAGPIDNPFDGLPLPGAAYSQGPLNHDGAGRITVAWRPGDDFDATLKVLGSYHHDWGGATEEVFACGANAHPSTLNLLNPSQVYADPYGDCKVNHVISNGQGPAQIVSHFFEAPADGKPFTETKAWLSSLVMNYRFNNLTLSSITGLYRTSRGDFDNYDLTVWGQALEAEHDKDLQLSQELRLASSFSGPVNFTAGAYYEHDRHDAGDTDKIFPLGPYPGPGPFNGVYNTLAMEARDKAESYSVFGQLSWKILEQLELAGGARYTHDTRSATIQNIFNYFDLFPSNPFSPVGVVYNPSISESNVSPEATLTYHPQSDITLYAAYKTGYLAGAIGNPANVSNYTTLPNPNDNFIYKAEKVHGFELGAKGLLFDDRVSAALTIYRYEYKDLQVATFHQENAAFFPGNAGKARSQGVELEGMYRADRHLSFNASLGYTDLKFLEYKGAQCYPGQPADQCPGGSQDLSGTRYGDGPFSGKVGFAYEHSLVAQLGMRLTTDVLHVSKGPVYERDPYAFTPAYTIVNATLRLFQENGPWQLSVIGTNLNNGIYYKNFIFKPLGLPTDIGSQSVSLPRQVTMQVEYKF